MIMRFIRNMEEIKDAKEELCDGIQEAISQVVQVKEIAQIKSLSVYDPEKVAKILSTSTARVLARPPW